MELTRKQRDTEWRARAFVSESVLRDVSKFEAEGCVPNELIRQLAAEGYLGAAITKAYGGSGTDAISYGIVCEAIGRVCCSARSLLTVQNMVASVVERWGTDRQKEALLPGMASGKVIAAFCLTEPEIGSDAANVSTRVDIDDESVAVNGHKVWVTFGQIADVFLVIGRAPAGPTAVLIERGAPGLSVTPLSGQLGLRAAMLAEVRMAQCGVGREAILAKPGLGFSHVAVAVLDHARYSVAWGCVGGARGCLEESVSYALRRSQFGVPLGQHQLIRRMISDMVTEIEAARQLCLHAGYLRNRRSRQALAVTMMAKYYASNVFFRSAVDAVQIHGASGVSAERPVERYLRDAKIMQIIEGSDQMMQLNICEFIMREGNWSSLEG